MSFIRSSNFIRVTVIALTVSFMAWIMSVQAFAGNDDIIQISDSSEQLLRYGVDLTDFAGDDKAVTGVTLNKSSVTLRIGKTKQLKATVLPESAENRKIVWSSADKNIASVDQNGVVKARKRGETTITATTEEGGFTASCIIYTETVIDDGQIKLDCNDPYSENKKSCKVIAHISDYDGKSVYVFKSEFDQFREGDEGSFDYIYDYYGDDDMLYKTVRLAAYDSSGKCIKSVWADSDNLGYFSLGNREMKKSHDYTVRVENYSEWYSYKMRWYKNIYNGYAKGMKGKKNLTLEKKQDYPVYNPYGYTPENTFSKITWKSSNTKIATVDRSGFVKAKRVGKCTITGKFENGPVVKWHITVKRPAPRLNATMVYMYKHQYFNLKMENKRGGKVKFWSTNKKVAKVTKKGKILSKGYGKCYIKAKYKGKTYKCRVVVTRH